MNKTRKLWCFLLGKSSALIPLILKIRFWRRDWKPSYFSIKFEMCLFPNFQSCYDLSRSINREETCSKSLLCKLSTFILLVGNQTCTKKMLITEIYQLRLQKSKMIAIILSNKRRSRITEPSWLWNSFTKRFFRIGDTGLSCVQLLSASKYIQIILFFRNKRSSCKNCSH